MGSLENVKHITDELNGVFTSFNNKEKRDHFKDSLFCI